MIKELVIRPSTVGSWMLCPGRTAQREADGFQHYPNEALLWGSAMHYEIEKRLMGEPLSMSDLELQLHEIFVKDVPADVKAKDIVYLNKVTTKAQRQQMVREVRNAADNWEQNVLPTIQDRVRVIEESLRALVGQDDKYRVFMQGTPDLVLIDKATNDIEIVDWKSAGRMWAPAKIEGQIQPIAYPWMYEESFGFRPKTFTFWVYDRSGDMWAPFTAPTPKHPVRENAFRVQAFNAAVQTERGEWTYQPLAKGGYKTRGWHCSPKYCDAWEPCHGKHLIADGQADVPAPTMKERFE